MKSYHYSFTISAIFVLLSLDFFYVSLCSTFVKRRKWVHILSVA